LVIIIGEVHFSDGALDALRPALARLVEAARPMPGCLHYSQSYDAADPNRLIVSQRWEDEESMNRYYQSTALYEFSREVDDATVLRMDIRSYRAEYLRTMLAKEG
jgi:quinol monooxygenase YgiN